MEGDTLVNILVVDDNLNNLTTLETILAQPGYRIIRANSGRQGLKHLLDRDFAVILLDVNMPDIDGFETASLIRARERTEAVPIIFITALLGDELSLFKGYSVGAVDYILSPIVPEILRAKVAVFVELFLKTEKIKRQSEQLRAAERKDHDLRLAETKRQLEMETWRITEEHLKREKEAEARSALALAEKARELERSNSDLEQFATIASHDLQEPLRTISSYCQLLEKQFEGKLEPETQDCLNYVVDAAKRMQLMIKSLLTYSSAKRERKAMGNIDCSQLLSEILDSVRAAIQESGALVSFDRLPKVTGERARLSQVFQNLISNAIKFRDGTRPIIRVSAKETDGYWTFCVADNGIGIDPQHFGKLFGVFQRLHTREEYPGTGIGLALCKKIIENHGGRMWVESELGKGARFYFTLPMVGEGKSILPKAA